MLYAYQDELFNIGKVTSKLLRVAYRDMLYFACIVMH